MHSKIITFVCGLLTALAIWAAVCWTQPTESPESLLLHNAGSHWGIQFNVTYEVQDHRGSAESDQLYEIQAIYRIHNWDKKAWKFKMPPVRSMLGTAKSFEYVQPHQHQEAWKEAQDFQLLPGETKVIRHELSYLTHEPLAGDLAQKKDTRVALVFDLPDDGDIREWVTGTILSEPIMWEWSKLKKDK